MLGAIAGDMIGSVHEWAGTKSTDFPLFTPASTFTDETLLTIAVADSLLDERDLADTFHEYFHRYPGAGFGGSFVQWAFRKRRAPYHSFGNGAAVRVSPIAFAFDTLDEVIARARASAMVTHDHEEGIAGAELMAACVFAARTGGTKQDIREIAERRFRYPVDTTLDEIRPDYQFDSTCRGSIPASLVAFQESSDFEGAVRNAISLGGDADTLASLTGAIAAPFYGGLPQDIAAEVRRRLDDPLRAVVDRFVGKFPEAARVTPN
ncbi:MAG: ADP-ribosylglycohydrolase family protein [Betaproteobacteria bacterium]|nr:ADP-ribosylglycohydrolase family protein [Betaproteobacteria bacterium]